MTGTTPSADHFFRIAAYQPGAVGLILRSSNGVTVSFSDDPQGGLVQLGYSGCMVVDPDPSCGIGIDASWLTAGSPVTVIVNGAPGTSYELEVVALAPPPATVPTTGYHNDVVYYTDFPATVNAAGGPFTLGAPTARTDVWAPTDSANARWFVYPNGFVCRSQPVTFGTHVTTSTSSISFGSLVNNANNGNLTLASTPGAAFTSGQSIDVAIAQTDGTDILTINAPAFTGDIGGTVQDQALLFDFTPFVATDLVFAFQAETAGAGRFDVACRKDVTGATGAAKTVTALYRVIAKDIEARGWAATNGMQIGACGQYEALNNVIKQAFTGDEGWALLCQIAHFPAAELRKVL